MLLGPAEGTTLTGTAVEVFGISRRPPAKKWYAKGNPRSCSPPCSPKKARSSSVEWRAVGSRLPRPLKDIQVGIIFSCTSLLLSTRSSKLTFVLSICSDRPPCNTNRQLINIHVIWTDQLGLHKHILRFLPERPRNRLAPGKGKSRRCGPTICGPTPFPASSSFYPSLDSGDREYIEYSSALS